MQICTSSIKKAQTWLRDSIMEGQDSFIMRELEDAEVDFGEDREDAVD